MRIIQAALTAVTVAAAATAAAQTASNTPREAFTAMAVNMTGGTTATVDIVVERWSGDADRDTLLDVYREAYALRLIEAFVIESSQPVHDPKMTGLREERVFIDESPEREKAVDASGVAVVPEDPRHLQHGRISATKGVCLSASYRARKRDDDSRMRSICGSRRVVQSANT